MGISAFVRAGGADFVGDLQGERQRADMAQMDDLIQVVRVAALTEQSQSLRQRIAVFDCQTAAHTF